MVFEGPRDSVGFIVFGRSWYEEGGLKLLAKGWADGGQDGQETSLLRCGCGLMKSVFDKGALWSDVIKKLRTGPHSFTCVSFSFLGSAIVNSKLGCTLIGFALWSTPSQTPRSATFPHFCSLIIRAAVDYRASSIPAYLYSWAFRGLGSTRPNLTRQSLASPRGGPFRDSYGGSEGIDLPFILWAITKSKGSPG